MTTELAEHYDLHQPAVRLVRPPDVSHKDFMFAQKAEWPDFWRIVLGKWTVENKYHQVKEIEWWCNENIKGRWFHSDDYEVYYFEDRNSAIYFKLKWFSQLFAS
jgi:hypothetical protein